MPNKEAMIKKLVSLFVCATLLITPILPVYAQTDVQLSAPSGVFHSPQLEKQLKLEILRQQVTPKALSRLNGYCAQMVTCTEQVSADGYATLLMDEAAYKQELLALAGKKM